MGTQKIMTALILAIMILWTSTCKAENSAAGTEPVGEEYQQQLARDLESVVQAYTKAVKHYNGNLPDAQAREIASSLLYYSNEYRIDPRLLVALIVVESRFKPQAVSPKGAKGLGQLMPGTARMMGVINVFDVRENLKGTASYLRMQYERWKTSSIALDLALASYNAGPESVARYGGVPPYRETRSYVENVKKLYHYYCYGN